MSHWMFDCQDISKKISNSLDRTLPLHERMMITAHLWMCKYCRQFKNQLQILRKALRLEELPAADTHQSPSLPAEIKERIKHAMRKTESDPAS